MARCVILLLNCYKLSQVLQPVLVYNSMKELQYMVVILSGDKNMATVLMMMLVKMRTLFGKNISEPVKFLASFKKNLINILKSKSI